MAAHSGPDLVQDGLLIYIDAANSKSYPGSGTTASDISGGTAYNGTLSGGPTFSTDNGLAVWRFDGSDDRLDVSDPSWPLQSIGYPFTIESAIYVPAGVDWWNDPSSGSSSGSAIVGRGSYSGSIGFLRNGTTDIRFRIRPHNTGRSVTYTAAFDRWYVLSGTFDGTQNANGMVFYVNGVSVGSTTVSDSLANFDADFYTLGGNVNFGGSELGGYVQGDIPYFRLYNRALSQNEVLQNFNATRGRFGL